MLTVEFLTEQANNNFQDIEVYNFSIDKFAETLNNNDEKGMEISLNVIVEHEEKFYRVLYTLSFSNVQDESYIDSITFNEVEPQNQMAIVWVDK